MTVNLFEIHKHQFSRDNNQNANFSFSFIKEPESKYLGPWEIVHRG